jgi:hypothetical protein
MSVSLVISMITVKSGGMAENSYLVNKDIIPKFNPSL